MEKNKMTKQTFLNVSQIITWAGTNDVQFVRSDKCLPYIFKDNLFYYFILRDKAYQLVMTSLHDLESFA
jgi:hypothetical protein